MLEKAEGGLEKCPQASQVVEIVSAIATRYVGGNDQELDVEKDKELVGDAVELASTRKNESRGAKSVDFAPRLLPASTLRLHHQR